LSSRPEAGPRIAVLIPCFEDGEFIETTVKSIREDEPIEIVVVDDGSTGELTLAALDRLEESGVAVIRHDDNRGVSAARNTALASSHAPFVFPLDADDLAIAGRLGEMANRLELESDAAVCYGDFLEFGRHLLLRAVPGRIDPYRLAYANEYPPAALFRRTALERVGGWHRVWDGLDARSDWGLWMSLAEEGARGLHFGSRVPTYLYRVHEPRLAMRGRRYHQEIYEGLRAAHPGLFGRVSTHRRESDLAPVRKLLYPAIYGRRALRPWEAEPHVKRVLDKLGLWTLQHRLTPEERDRFGRMVTSAGGRMPAE